MNRGIAVIGQPSSSVVELLKSKFPNEAIVVVDDVRDVEKLRNIENFKNDNMVSELIQTGMREMEKQVAEIKSIEVIKKSIISDAKTQMKYRARHFNRFRK